MDTLSVPQRSERMARVRSKDTKSELIVRRMVHRLGFRYRLHGKGLPGKPDMVFASRMKVIFVHGCFWHRHTARCPLTRMPKSNLEFWQSKFEENHRRDEKHVRLLRAAGWKVLTVWECQISRTDALKARIIKFLGD
jgi:DNA mismatch endonuclease (patch repair protein)